MEGYRELIVEPRIKENTIKLIKSNEEFLGSYRKCYAFSINALINDERYSNSNSESKNALLFLEIANKHTKSKMGVLTIIKSKYLDAQNFLEVLYKILGEYRDPSIESVVRVREENNLTVNACKIKRVFSKDLNTNEKVLCDLRKITYLRNIITHRFCSEPAIQAQQIFRFLYEVSNFIKNHEDCLIYAIDNRLKINKSKCFS